MSQESVIPANAGIQYEKDTSRSGQAVLLFRLRGEFLIRWTPAFAGMTA